MLLVRGGCRMVPEEEVQRDMRRSMTGSVDVLRRRLGGLDEDESRDEGREEEASLELELGDTDRRGRWIMEGFPE